MAWGLEARVPFLDKAFLEAAMNVDPKEKMFRKGENTEVDDDGRPKMEKVGFVHIYPSVEFHIFFHTPQYILRKAFDCSPDGKVIAFATLVEMINLCLIDSRIFLGPFCGGRRSNSPMALDIRG
jgi:hypothetical protein